MTIAHIANDEAGSSVRTKLNATIDAANGALVNPVSYTSATPGIAHIIDSATVSLGADLVSGIRVTNISSDTTGLTAYSTGGAAIFAGFWPFSEILTSLDVSGLQAVLCAISVGNLRQLAVWDLSSLSHVVGDITGNADGMASLDISSLKTIYGSFTAQFPDLASINLSSLESIAGGAATPGFPLLTALDLSSLVYVSGVFDFAGDLVTSVDLSALETVGGILGFFTPVLVTLAFPALTHMGAGFGMSGGEAAVMENFSINAGLLVCNGDFNLLGAALTQASVDGILVRLAGLDGTGGTTSYDNRSVDLSGGTSASPSATGLAAKATLEGRGCTVTVN